MATQPNTPPTPAPPPPPPTHVAADQVPVSDIQIHYTQLLAYFKHLVWLTGVAVAIVVAVAGVLLYSNLRDVRQDAKDQAERVAKDEAQKAVSRAFDEKNVQAMILKAAQEKVGSVTDKMIEQQLTSKLQPIQDRILSIGHISECEARIHTGFRSGLVELNSILSGAKDPLVRQFAQSTLTTTSEGYDSYWQASPFWKTASQQPPPQLISSLNQVTGSHGTTQSGVSDLAGVVRIINEDQELNDVAFAFLVFREVTGDKSIKMFDFPAVNRWCTNHEPQCKPSPPAASQPK